MKNISIIIFFVIMICSCSNDRIVKEEKQEFVGIFKNITQKKSLGSAVKVDPTESKMNRAWLSKFKQPIILISSLDKKKQATLVALGNNDEKITWVSADGISLTYDNGILIATRGYSEDLFAVNISSNSRQFGLKKSQYRKVHRYLLGDNKYNDITFECVGTKIVNQSINILDYKLPVDKLIETCENAKFNYVNEYDLLAGTEVVVKSKQWISPSNNSFLTYNLYAFQKI